MEVLLVKTVHLTGLLGFRRGWHN